jgi:hypothetical protein
MNQQTYLPQGSNASLLDKRLYLNSYRESIGELQTGFGKGWLKPHANHEWWTGAQAAKVFVIFDVHLVNL